MAKKKNETKDESSNESDLAADNEEIMEVESVNGNTEESSTQIDDQVQALGEKVKKLREELEKEKKEQLYLRAEFDTVRRRAIKERSDLLKYAGERTIVSMLGVLDNFERALETKISADNFEKFRDGVQLIAEELRNAIKREGVEEVQPKDDKFDPNIFEAISSEDSQDKAPGDITRIFRKAYKLHDKIIRPGQVILAKSSDEKND